MAAATAAAAPPQPELLAQLTDEQRRAYLEWHGVRDVFDRQHDAYWAEIAARRAERRRKSGAGLPVTPDDFVMRQPPKYSGPALRADIAKIQAALVPPKPETEIATLPDMLAAARQHYNFAPSLTTEREFKRRYALEALALGMTKEQVVRVYALETGGRGTFDMQAGINPETKAGKPISTAMGYAQLLAANSIDELVRHGEGFIARLNVMAGLRGTSPERAQELRAKVDSLRAMLRTARSVPREWSRHVELSTTPLGFGIHVINLDADIGPWLQVIKLNGLKELGEKNGRPELTPAELELMNLAGPRTGLDMLEPVGSAAPTANFFSQGGYYRNSIVRERTAGELLAAIDVRMTENMARAGAIEFATVFDEVRGQRGPSPAGNVPAGGGPAERQNLQKAPQRPPSPAPTAAAPSSAATRQAPVQAPFEVPSQGAPPLAIPVPVPATAPPSRPVPSPVAWPGAAAGDQPTQPRLNWAPPHLTEALATAPLGFPQ